MAVATAFTNVGAAIVTNRIIQSGTAPKYIGWGTGSTTAAVLDTVLGAEAAPTSSTRVAANESRTTTTVTNDTYTLTGAGATITAGGTLAIQEAGAFDAATGGNLLIRGTFATVNVVINDSIAFTFNLKIAANVV